MVQVAKWRTKSHRLNRSRDRERILQPRKPSAEAIANRWDVPRPGKRSRECIPRKNLCRYPRDTTRSYKG